MAGNYSSNIHDNGFRSYYDGHRISERVAAERSTRCSLDGEWHFTKDTFESALRGHWPETVKKRGVPADFDFEEGGMIKVPACWNTELPELRNFENDLIYYRTFTVPEELNGAEEYFLRFEGVAYRAYVFLNGEYLGCHDGASTPFTVKLTGRLKDENELTVIADAHREAERIPAVNYDWEDWGGIFRSVYLMSAPSLYTRSWSIHYDGRYVKIHAEYSRSGDFTVRITSELFCTEVKAVKGVLDACIECTPELWSPESPRLYDFTLEVPSTGEVLNDRIALRTISTDGDRILLNGKNLFLKGICVQEDYPGKGRSESEEDIRGMIAEAKELGCNFIRLAHYPHSPLTARLADEMGILLWEEIPVYWAIAFDSPVALSDARGQLEELIERDRNRGSVIIWSVGNENADTDERLAFMSDLADLAHELDKTRLVSAACLVNHEKLMIEDRLEEKLDIIGVNEYFGWYADITQLPTLLERSRKDKPVVVTEWGAEGAGGFHGPDDELFTEECQERIYRTQLGILPKYDYIRGIVPWILYDFHSPRRLGKWQRGFNRKGLIRDDHKTRKKAYYALKEFYTKGDKDR